MVLAVIAGGYYLLTVQLKPSATAEAALPDGVQTAKVERGSLEAVINATGSLTPEREVKVSFASAGTVREVLVAQGDAVEHGQLLARLDDEDLRLSVKQAEASLASSQAQLVKARKGATDEELAAAQAAVDSAKASLADARKGSSARDLELARLSVDQAKNSLWSAQGSRDAIGGQPFADGGQKTQSEAQVANAEVAVKIAEIKLEQLSEPAKAAAIAAAEAQVAQAESTLAKLQALPSDEDVALVRAQVRQAEVSVEIAQSRLDDVERTAPMAGKLVAWDLHVDDLASPGVPVGTIIDESRYHVDFPIDETDIGRVQVGQDATITLDAYPDAVLAGKVTKVATLGTNAQGIVTYAVQVELAATDLGLKPQMTCAVDIIVDRRADVLLVPNRALRRDKDGKYVEVLKANIPTKVYVETGVANDTMTELLSGLDEGQDVITSRPRDSMFAGGPFGG
jgi:HlyD family secretion protein